LVVDLINAACGFDWDIERMLLCGERGWNLKRAINNRLGLTRANDRLPKAFLQPYVDAVGEKKFTPDFEPMLAAYYRVRGWDPVSGYPGLEQLRALGLDWVARELYPTSS
jgi:aldehyde:ferredoxin oxidoreductase